MAETKREMLARVAALALPSATAASVGIEAKPDSGEEGARQIAFIDLYLSDFLRPELDCVGCGKTLTGLFGSFQWGIAHGEGFCGGCGYPARGYHRIPDPKSPPDGSPVVALRHILQYRPERLTAPESTENEAANG